MGKLLNLKQGAVGTLRRPIEVASENGAVASIDGAVHITKAGVCALTLAAPSAALDGLEIEFISETAQAHTVTQASPGFNGGGAGSDVATFGGAVGDGFKVRARNGIWWVVDKTNVTVA